MDRDFFMLIIVGVLLLIVFVGFGMILTGEIIQEENELIRILPDSVKPGQIFYVDYSPTRTDSALEVKIHDSVSGGCEFLQGGETFDKNIFYIPENMKKGTFKVKAPDSQGYCMFEGDYEILDADEKLTKRLSKEMVLVE